MSEVTMIETMRDIPRRETIRLSVQVNKLRDICKSDLALEPFLSESLQVLFRLFGARAGAFWFRPFNAATLCPVSRLGFDHLGLPVERIGFTEQIVRGAWQAVAPQIHSIDKTHVSLVAPIRDGTTAIGALQMIAVCNEKQLDEAKILYAQALSSVLGLLQPALHRRMQIGETSIQDAVDRLGQLANQLTSLQQSMRQAIDQTLSQLAGASFGSLEANQRFTRVMQELLDAHGLRVVCPECQNAAILRCSKNPRAVDGVFVFDHYLSGTRTFHGGSTTLPALKVTSKPPRKGKRLAAS